MKTQSTKLGYLLAALCLPVAALHAHTVSVDANAGIGVVAVAADGQCSLREAMVMANGIPGSGECTIVADSDPGLIVELPADSIFTLDDGPYLADGANGLPDVVSSFSIAGHGATIQRSSAPGTPAFRLLHVATSGNLTVHHLGFRNGHTADGADAPPPKWNDAADGADGGAIYNAGTLSLSHCTISGNVTGSGGNGVGAASGGGDGGSGGGIFSSGLLTIEHCTVSNNRTGDGGNKGSSGYAGSGGGGGGIASIASLSGALLDISHSVVSHNVTGAGGIGESSSGGDGGGIYSKAPLSIDWSTINDNQTGMGTGWNPSSGKGGGIYAIAHDVTLHGTRVVGNVIPATPNESDSAEGAGVYAIYCSVSIDDSVISDNSNLSGDGGGIAAFGRSSEYLTIFRSSLTGNSAAGSGGGLYADMDALVFNSTIAGNTSVSGEGGGADMRGTPGEISYSTITDNAGGGLLVSGGAVVADHSIIANQTSGDDCVSAGADPASHGYNLDSDDSCGFAYSTDLPGRDPQLGTLGDHGGPTPTLVPLVGSPVIDVVPLNDCVSAYPGAVELETDQRGAPRPQGAACDIGAVEHVATFVLRALGQNDQQALAGDVFAQPLVVQALDAGGNPVVGVVPEVTAPASGASALCSAGATDNTGIARVLCVANAVAGSYPVRISTPFGPNAPPMLVTYSLTNLPNDRIFGSGFDGASLPAAETLP